MKYQTPDNPFDQYSGLGTVQSLPEDYDASSVQTSTDDFDEPVRPQRPLTPLFLITVLIAGFLGVRLIDLQIVEGTKNRVLAEDNRIRNREIPPPRGEI